MTQDNINANTSFILSIADLLRGDFKPSENGRSFCRSLSFAASIACWNPRRMPFARQPRAFPKKRTSRRVR